MSESRRPIDHGCESGDLPALTLAALMKVIERLDSLADTAELMGDADGTARFREAAWSRRQAAMELLDDG